MIKAPVIGQRVQIWYAAYYAHRMPLHGLIGILERTPRNRRGPGNVAVRLEVSGEICVVPRGNIRMLQLCWNACETAREAARDKSLFD